jgi:hypothetical protein
LRITNLVRKEWNAHGVGGGGFAVGVDETSSSARGARILHETIRGLAPHDQLSPPAGNATIPTPATSSAKTRLSRSDDLFICLIVFLGGMTSIGTELSVSPPIALILGV